LKSFDQTFSKVCEVEGAQPSSLSAESETSPGVSFLITFFFAPVWSKKKVADKAAVTNVLRTNRLKSLIKTFIQLTKVVTQHESFNTAFSFGEKGAKEKAWQKEKRRSKKFRALRSARRAPRPPLRRLLKKAGENFSHGLCKHGGQNVSKGVVQTR